MYYTVCARLCHDQYLFNFGKNKRKCEQINLEIFDL